MSEWRFERRQGACRACARAFAEEERHASALVVRGEELVREDLCAACFAGRDLAQDVFYWFTRHRSNRRKLQLDLATLEQIFLHLEGRAEPRVREMRYVLCLLLMRKRRLKLERVLRRADGELMLVRRPRRKESLEVYVFDFAPERMAELRLGLLAIFEGAEPLVVGGAEVQSEDAAEGGLEAAERADGAR